MSVSCDKTTLKYQEVLVEAQNMLGHAKAGCWRRVAQSSHAISRLTDRIESPDRSTVQTQAGDRDSQRERSQILIRLVQIDAQIRALREPSLGRLDTMMAAHAAGPDDRRATRCEPLVDQQRA